MIDSSYAIASDPNTMRDLGWLKNVQYRFDAEPEFAKNSTTESSKSFFNTEKYLNLKDAYSRERQSTVEKHKRNKN